MEKNRSNSDSSKKTRLTGKDNLPLSVVAAKLKGKDLFPEKIEKARLFFSKLDLAKE